MSSVTPLPLHDCWASLAVLDYLGLLWPDRPQKAIADAIAHGLVRSTGRRVEPWELAGELDALELTVPLESIPRYFSGGDSPEAVRDLVVLHEDDRLVAIEKPSGMPVIPDRSRSTPSCLELLTRRELDARRSKPPEAWLRYRIVHRIDRQTSGLVLIAKTLETERRFGEDFERHAIGKEYLALVVGSVDAARVTVACPIAPGRKGKMRAQPGPDAKDAETTFDVLERGRDVTLVCARPRTGRTHQIRVHAWAMGHPLAVDPLYRVGEHARREIDAGGMTRLTLHAWRYTLPETWAEPRVFECPLAADLERACGALFRNMSSPSRQDPRVTAASQSAETN